MGRLNTSSRFGVVEHPGDCEAPAEGITARISSPARRASEAILRSRSSTERNAAGGGRRRRGRPLRIVGGYLSLLFSFLAAAAPSPGPEKTGTKDQKPLPPVILNEIHYHPSRN